MGLYDTILVYMECPYCGFSGQIECQTKDLGNHMHTYHPLRSEWYKKGMSKEKRFRVSLPVFPQFPQDKEFTVWKNQAERIEAHATVPKEFRNLKYINVIASCESVECQFDGDRISILWQGCPSGFSRSFEGKIRIRNGRLIGEVYDIEKDDYTERKLNYYKVKYKEIFDKLKKKYRHEPIICRHWHEGVKIQGEIQDNNAKKKRKAS